GGRRIISQKTADGRWAQTAVGQKNWDLRAEAFDRLGRKAPARRVPPPNHGGGRTRAGRPRPVQKNCLGRKRRESAKKRGLGRYNTASQAARSHGGRSTGSSFGQTATPLRLIRQ